MENSGKKVKRHKILRLETLRRAKTSKCIGGCKGNLLKLANDNLNRNNSTFFRCNHCSIVGITNWGKTLVLKNLCQNLETLLNPATKEFAQVGEEKANIIF